MKAGAGRGRKWMPLLIVLGLVGMVSAGFAYNVYKQTRCPGHWHASFTVVVDGERVDFTHPGFQFEGAGQPGLNNNMPLSSHIHRGDDYEWHFEPNPSRCQGFGQVTQFVGMHLERDRLTLGGHHASIPLGDTGRMQGGEYVVEGNKTLRAFHQVDGEAWKEIGIGDLLDRQLRDGERILIMYGDHTPEQVRQFKDSAPAPPTYVNEARRQGRDPNYLPA
jgi:hypothetical protein